MRIRFAPVVPIGLVLVLSACSASAQVTTWQVDGETREAIVYAPDAPQGDEQVPLVFSFHGRGDNMQNFQHTNVHVAWPEAIVVYFQGLSTGGGLSGWQAGRGADGDRDLKLVDVALASLREAYNVDDDRIYATGFSNGGMFTYLLWSERSGVFAAYAPVAGRLRPSVELTQPRPVLHVAGRRDRQVAFEDQEAAIASAVEANGGGASAVSCGDGCTLYGSDEAAPVMTWIHPGGHVYPRETSDRIVSFFRDHSRTR
jgi:polyhydroxybutyrate depolymerase